MELITIERFILERQQQGLPEAKGDFTKFLYYITCAAKIIARDVNKAGLVEYLVRLVRQISRVSRSKN